MPEVVEPHTLQVGIKGDLGEAAGDHRPVQSLLPLVAPSLEEGFLEHVLGRNSPLDDQLTEAYAIERLKLLRELSGDIYPWDEDNEEIKGLTEDERIRWQAHKVLDQAKVLRDI